MKWPCILLILCVLAGGACAALRDLPYKEKYETPEFAIKFQPIYPLVIGESSRIIINTALRAKEIMVYLPDGQKLKLMKAADAWSGSFTITENFKEGWQPIFIYLKHEVPIDYRPALDQMLDFLRIPTGPRTKDELLTRRIWVRAFKPPPPAEPLLQFKLPAMATSEALALELYSTPEAVTPEAYPLIIRGTRLFSFTSRSIEGSKEGYVPGVNREESLRINVSGTVQETSVDANFFQTSTLGTTQMASQEQHISIKLSRASTEAYFGDFTADLTDVEFARLNKVLSGVKLSGYYDKWSFKALATTPQGSSRQVKVYGDGTQGPYYLNGAPVVIDSERVYVDGVRQKRGSDYDIDHQAGTVTFKYKTIIKTSIIEIYYDQRSTLYTHSTYALRGRTVVTPNLKIGATWIDDSDSLKDAQSIFQASGTIEPQSHYILGLDGSLALSDLLMAEGEVAYSEKAPHLLTDPSSRDIGKAGKLVVSSNLGPLGFVGKAKRIGPLFESAAEALPKTEVTEYSGFLTYRPNDLILSSANYGKESYVQSGTRFDNSDKNFKLELTSRNLPAFSYLLDELQESNDPVPPYTPFDRLTVKNRYELKHTLRYMNLSAQAQDERRIVRSPSEEVTTYKTVNFGISTANLEKLTATANLELKDTLYSASPDTFTKTLNLNLSASPRREYMAALSLNYIDDNQDGITNVTELSFRAEPSEKLKADGKYAVTSVRETFGSTEEGVLKYASSLKLEVRPLPPLRLRYYYRPNFTVVSRTQGLSYNNENQQYEMNFLLGASAMLGASYSLTRNFLSDKTDFPTYRRKNSSQDTGSQIYTFKAAPLRFLSTEFNYRRDDGLAYNLLAPASAETYGRTNQKADEVTVAIRSSLSEKFAIDSTYSNRITKSGSAESQDDNLNTLAQTGSIKGILNLTEAFTLTASYAYTQSLDLRAVSDPTTYTIAPGAGFIYRLAEVFRLDGDYTYSKSYAGSSTEKYVYSLRAKYDVLEILHLTVRVDREVSLAPDYKTTDFYGNLELIL